MHVRPCVLALLAAACDFLRADPAAGEAPSSPPVVDQAAKAPEPTTTTTAAPSTAAPQQPTAPQPRRCDAAALRTAVGEVVRLRAEWTPRSGRPFAGPTIAAQALWQSCPDRPTVVTRLLDQIAHLELGDADPTSPSLVDSLLADHAASHSIPIHTANDEQAAAAQALATRACPHLPRLLIDPVVLDQPGGLYNGCGLDQLGLPIRYRYDVVAAAMLLGWLDGDEVDRAVSVPLVDAVVNHTTNKLSRVGPPLSAGVLLPTIEPAAAPPPRAVIVEIGTHHVAVAGTKIADADPARGAAGVVGAVGPLRDAVAKASVVAVFMNPRERLDVVFRADRRTRAEVLLALVDPLREGPQVVDQIWIAGLGSGPQDMVFGQPYLIDIPTKDVMDVHVSRSELRYACRQRPKPGMKTGGTVPTGVDPRDDDPATERPLRSTYLGTWNACGMDPMHVIHAAPDVPLQTLLAVSTPAALARAR